MKDIYKHFEKPYKTGTNKAVNLSQSILGSLSGKKTKFTQSSGWKSQTLLKTNTGTCFTEYVNIKVVKTFPQLPVGNDST